MATLNLPYDTTDYVTELQSRLNAVLPATAIDELASLFREASLVNVTTTIFAAEVQSRLDAVGPSTTNDDMRYLAWLVGSMSNKNQADIQTLITAVNAIDINPIAPVRTGYIATGSLSSGASEDDKYVDIVIAPVADVTRAKITFDGGATNGVDSRHASYINFPDEASGVYSSKVTFRFINTSTIRISCVEGNVSIIYGRWTVEGI